MESNKMPPAEREINFKTFWRKLLEKWYIPVCLILVSLLISFFYLKFICKPIYTSSAKIYIFNNSTQAASNELAISTYLTKDYTTLIVDRTVLDEVIKQLDLNTSYGSLKSCISVDNPEDTRIIEITVRTGNPAISQKIADSVCVVAQEKIVELMGIDRVNIISKAYLPASPSYPAFGTGMLYGMLIGLILSFVIISILCMQDDKISSADDVKKYLGMSVLATIPYSRGKGKASAPGHMNTARN